MPELSKQVLVERTAQQQLVGEYRILTDRAFLGGVIDEEEYKNIMKYIKEWEDVLY